MTQQIDHDWALIQAVENARLLRRSEHRKMEAQVSTKCLMRADARRDRDAVKRAKEEQTTGGAADATETKALGKKRRSNGSSTTKHRTSVNVPCVACMVI